MSSNEYTSVQLNTDKPSQTYSKAIDKTEITISTRELRSSKPEIHYLLGPNEEILKTGNRTHSLEDLQLTPSSTRRGSTARTLKSPIKALSKLTKSILDLRHPQFKRKGIPTWKIVFEDPSTNNYPLPPPLTDYRLTPPPEKPPNYPWGQLRGLTDFSEHLAEAAAAPLPTLDDSFSEIGTDYPDKHRGIKGTPPPVVYEFEPNPQIHQLGPEIRELHFIPPAPNPQIQPIVLNNPPIQQNVQPIPGPQPADQTDEMAESTVVPQPFNGKSTEDPGNWLRHFENYCTYKGLTDVQKRNFFRVLMAGSAADWLENAHIDDNNATFDNYKTLFETRYKVPEIMRFKWARELFSRPQGTDENVDDYVIQMQKLGKIVGINEEMLNYAILNGLKPHIANFVTQRAPRTIDELMAAARIAELTIPAPRDADLHAKVDKLVNSWDKMTTSAVQEQRSPTPPKRVTFEGEDRTRNWNPQRRRGGYEAYTPGPRFNSQRQWQNPNQPHTFRPFQQRGYVQAGIYQPRYLRPQMDVDPATSELRNGTSRCTKCGFEQHSNINQCPALNQSCWTCGRRGHFSRACKSLERVNRNF